MFATRTIKLRALWRHPLNSIKRKEFRTNSGSFVLGSGGSRSRVWTNLAAIVRHPFSTNKRKTWRDAVRFAAVENLGSSESKVADLAGLSDPEFHSMLYDQYVGNSLAQFQPSEYVEIAKSPPVSAGGDVKLIAYYLPQFHPFPENEEWWGKGFTEWRNVARAFPLFDGHYQPRVPGELGYYDLRAPQVMKRQVELAKLYGISAFCFHFYWFAGKRLMELPVDHYLATPELDLPFSFCWANENWSRRWDGSESDILIAQQHSPADDIAFLHEVERYFRDPRYLRIDGKPVLTIYRPSLLPNALETTERLRAEARKLGYPDLYLISTNSFGFLDYQAFGFDALSEFPPHNVNTPNLQGRLRLSKYREGWRIRHYADVVANERGRSVPAGKVHHPGVMPSWDNSARRPTGGEIIHGSTPALFGKMLDNAINRTKANPIGQRLVFINAWNEWAEGAYLEPDAKFGYAYLQECANALVRYEDGRGGQIIKTDRLMASDARRILLCSHHVGHELFGGERSFLDVAKALHVNGFNVCVVLPNRTNVQYVEELKQYSSEIRIISYSQWKRNASGSLSPVPIFLKAIDDFKPDLVYVNTIVITAPLMAARIRLIPTMVHAREIIRHDPELCAQIGLEAEAIVSQVWRSADHMIANSCVTAQCFGEPERTSVIPNVVSAEGLGEANESSDGIVRFGIISSNLPKKGFEDVIELARLCEHTAPKARFLVIGSTQRPLIAEYIAGKIPAPPNVEFVDYQSRAVDAIRRVNVILNFSHFQESFGRTILEGMVAARPAIVYNWGAVAELVEHGKTGFVIPFKAPHAAVPFVKQLCENPELLKAMSLKARARAMSKYSFGEFSRNLGDACHQLIDRSAARPDRYSKVRATRLSKIENVTIDIVVCVHNALEDVRRCIPSVVDNLRGNHRLIIVDDGSSTETQRYLAEVTFGAPNIILKRNEHAVGYTVAANLGLSVSEASLVILLNSDTIVTSGWAEKMADAVFNTPGGGIVSAMSNAASFQSLPEVASDGFQTPVNELPRGISPEDLNRLCEQWATEEALVVPLVHGFCFGITRDTLNTLGLFDEVNFKDGYGEENEYCFRAVAAGIWPVIAAHTFVFHAKTKSYTNERRNKLVQRAQRKLYDMYGQDLFEAAVAILREHPVLTRMREQAKRVALDVDQEVA